MGSIGDTYICIHIYIYVDIYELDFPSQLIIPVGSAKSFMSREFYAVLDQSKWMATALAQAIHLSVDKLGLVGIVAVIPG